MTTQFLIKELDRAFKDYLKNEDIEIYESKLKRIKEDYQIGEPIRVLTSHSVLVQRELEFSMFWVSLKW